MSPRTGRPPSDDPKTKQQKIRFSDRDTEKLEYAANVLGLTKADVIRQGVDYMYEKAQKQTKK